MIIVSGPSTVGKNPFIYKACQLYGLKFVIPYTTRKIRTEEENGKDYYFISKDDFQSKIQKKEIIEWDYCLNNYYGYSFDFPGEEKHITHGLSRMALRIKDKYPDNIFTLFLMPKNIDRIFYNLNQIYCGNDLTLRQALVEEELIHSNLFDKTITCSDSASDLLAEHEIKNLLYKMVKKLK